MQKDQLACRVKRYSLSFIHIHVRHNFVTQGIRFLLCLYDLLITHSSTITEGLYEPHCYFEI